MSNSGTKLIFFGTEEFSLHSLRALVENDFDIRAVVTKPDSARGRGHKIVAPSVKTYALDRGITVWQPADLTDIANDIKALHPVAGVLVSYGKIIPQSIIELFTPGIINLHPSLLPKYRGPSPIESAIANRDGVTGVSLMQLSTKMDAGPVYAQLPYALDQNETGPELYDTLGQLGANLLVSKLPDILSGQLAAEPQDETAASYCQLLSKADNLIDPETMTPGEAEARIRAHLGYPRSRIVIDGQPTIVTKAHVVMTAETPLDIKFANGAYLRIDELINQNGKTVTATSYLNGRAGR